MKTYFENENVILPFSSVKILCIENNRVKAYFGENNEDYFYFPTERHEDYKRWLAMQLEKDKVIANQLDLSEILTSLNYIKNKVEKIKLTDEQLVKIINKVNCSYCEIDHHTKKCKNCELYDSFRPNNTFVKEINIFLEDE